MEIPEEVPWRTSDLSPFRSGRLVDFSSQPRGLDTQAVPP